MGVLIENSTTGSMDIDRDETQEWLESLEAVVRDGGSERGQFLLKQLEQHARALGITSHVHPYSAYRNTESPLVF